jgi:hypothetical protein
MAARDYRQGIIDMRASAMAQFLHGATPGAGLGGPRTSCRCRELGRPRRSLPRGFPVRPASNHPEHPRLGAAAFRAVPRQEIRVDGHCVTPVPPRQACAAIALWLANA